MSKLTLAMATALAAGLLAGPAAADQHKEMKDAGKSMESRGVMGKHMMGGTVKSIDHDTGWLELETGAGTLRLHYPPPALKGVEIGDSLTADLGFRKGK